MEQELKKEIARLESINDQLSSEIAYVDQLMRLLGFTGGLETVKATAFEIIEKGYNLDQMEEEQEENNGVE